MKSMDNKIKYYELLMYYNDTSKYKRFLLPNGFHFKYYEEGDIEDWVNIHILSGEFTSFEEGEKIFNEYFDSFIDELDKRCIFIIDDKSNKKVATATVSLLKEKEYGFDAACDWLAITKEYQGKKLSKPLVCKMIETANNLGHKRLVLHTQTTTWLAAKIYLDFGFEILNKNEMEGWNILKTLTNHDKLINYNIIDKDLIYDKRIVEIEKLLISMFKTDELNYGVYYKNNHHDVSVFYKNNTYKYEYYYDNGVIKLKEIK